MSVPVPPVTAIASIDALTSGLIDYAGLFPPAELDMTTAVRNFASYANDEYRRVLNRFIVPVARLEEFEGAAAPYLGRAGARWHLSVLAGPRDIEAGVSRVADFNRRHRPGRGTGRASIDAIEAKSSTAAEIAELARLRPADVAIDFEVPTAADPSPLIGEIARAGGRAKIRTGGVTPDAIPSVAEVVRFLRACARGAVAFKATAGLHHAVRGEYKLTYAADSPCAVMHGFLNVFCAAAFVRTGIPATDAVAMMEETAPEAFQFDGAGVTWRNRRITTPAIAAARANYSLSFGSCSFHEPIEELRALHLL
jgi:hypothetical protein